MRVAPALVAIAVAAGCDPAGPAVRAARDPRALVVARPSDILGLDPARVTDSESIEVGELLYEGLVRLRPGGTDVVPGLATSWDASPDGLRWVFHLRDGVRFHDGAVLDAAAVARSFERLLDPASPAYCREASFFRSLLGAVRRVVAVEPHTVAIELARPHAPLLDDLVIVPILAPAAIGAGDEPARPIGTGPFRLEQWTPGREVVVRRFEGYWGEAPSLDRVVFKVVVDARQRLIGLESGSVDLATAILPDEQAFVDLHPDLALHHAPVNAVSYLAVNAARPPLDDLRVRQAINLAINKEPIVRLAFHGRAQIADGPLPRGQWAFHLAAGEPRGRDVRAARALLAAAAADGARATRPLRLYVPDSPRPHLPEPEAIARMVAASLAEVGLRTELVVQPTAAHRASLMQGEHDLALWGWVGDTADPDDFLSVLFDADPARPGASPTVRVYGDAALHALLGEARMATARAARARAYAEVQERLAVVAPWVPLVHGELVVAARAELLGVTLNLRGHPLYAQIRRAGAR